MMHMNLLAGKGGIYIILEIRCSLHQVGESLEDAEVFLLNGRRTPKMHVPSVPSGDRRLMDAGFHWAS